MKIFKSNLTRNISSFTPGTITTSNHSKSSPKYQSFEKKNLEDQKRKVLVWVESTTRILALLLSKLIKFDLKGFSNFTASTKQGQRKPEMRGGSEGGGEERGGGEWAEWGWGGLEPIHWASLLNRETPAPLSEMCLVNQINSFHFVSWIQNF